MYIYMESVKSVTVVLWLIFIYMCMYHVLLCAAWCILPVGIIGRIF